MNNSIMIDENIPMKINQVPLCIESRCRNGTRMKLEEYATKTWKIRYRMRGQCGKHSKANDFCCIKGTECHTLVEEVFEKELPSCEASRPALHLLHSYLNRA